MGSKDEAEPRKPKSEKDDDNGGVNDPLTRRDVEAPRQPFKGDDEA